MTNRAEQGEYNWEVVEDGYNKKSRLVEGGTGRIIGYVDGDISHNCEWCASSSLFDGSHIGYYVTEGQAKKAVERAVHKAAKHIRIEAK